MTGCGASDNCCEIHRPRLCARHGCGRNELVPQATLSKEQCHRGFGGGGLGLGTPVVSYAPRPISQVVECIDEVIIDALSETMLERNILAVQKTRGTYTSDRAE